MPDMAEISSDTTNITLNVTFGEKNALAQLAARIGTDAGRVVKHYYIAALEKEHPDVAAEIQAAREAHRVRVQKNRDAAAAKRWGSSSVEKVGREIVSSAAAAELHRERQKHQAGRQSSATSEPGADARPGKAARPQRRKDRSK